MMLSGTNKTAVLKSVALPIFKAIFKITTLHLVLENVFRFHMDLLS